MFKVGDLVIRDKKRWTIVATYASGALHIMRGDRPFDPQNPLDRLYARVEKTDVVPECIYNSEIYQLLNRTSDV